MEANGDRLQLWLEAEKFDQLVQNVLGDLRQYEVAERLGINNSTWSLYRTKSRPLNAEFVAAAMELFPGVPPTHWFTTAKKAVASV